MANALFLSHLYPTPRDRWRGQAIHQAALNLKSLGCQVEVISPVPWVPPGAARIRKRWVEYTNIPTQFTLDDIEIKYPRFTSVPRRFLPQVACRSMYNAVSSTVVRDNKASSVDVIHAHSLFPDGVVAGYLSDALGAPYVLTVRGTGMRLLAQRSTFSRTLHKALQKASCVIAPSPVIHRALRSFGYNNAKLIPNGFTLKPQPEARTRAMHRRADDGRFVVLSASRLLQAKGLQQNIHALATIVGKFPQVQYVIAGEGPYRPALESLVQEYALQGHVTFLGNVDHCVLASYLSMCDVFSLPSWNETFGIAYLEAMAHAKPVIFTLGDGIDGIAVQGVSGIGVRREWTDDVRSALFALITQPELRLRLGRNAAEAANRYAWPEHASAILKEYQKLSSQAQARNRFREVDI